jgi:hypothetical protein
MRLVYVASLLFSAVFAAQTTGKDAPSANELIEQLTQLPKCAVCVTTPALCSPKDSPTDLTPATDHLRHTRTLRLVMRAQRLRLPV